MFLLWSIFQIGKCKYNIVRNGDNKHLCDDECFRQFRVSPTVYLRSMSPVNASASSSISVASSMEQATPHYKICSVCQLMNINTNKHFLNWQGLDFCGEECLGKFQSSLGGTCSFCGSQVNYELSALWEMGGGMLLEIVSCPCTQFVIDGFRSDTHPITLLTAGWIIHLLQLYKIRIMCISSPAFCTPSPKKKNPFTWFSYTLLVSSHTVWFSNEHLLPFTCTLPLYILWFPQ